MSYSARVSFIALWLISLALVGALASAQAPRHDPAPGPIISGTDIGFRPEGWRGKKRTGTWMVRIDGEWVEVVDTMRTAPATTR